jgi:hypothetical protein
LFYRSIFAPCAAVDGSLLALPVLTTMKVAARRFSKTTIVAQAGTKARTIK